MDQPYTATVRTLLAIQKYKADDPPPYDDTGWTLDQLRHVETFAVADSAVLRQTMAPLAADAVVEGRVSGSGPVLLVRHLGDWRSAVLPWKLGGARVEVADSAFAAGGASYPAGTFVLAGLTGGARAAAERTLRALGLDAVAVGAAPAGRRHAVGAPRIAYVHSWVETQNEVWVRFALDQMGVPYTYMSEQQLGRAGALDRYDVVLYPHVSASPAVLVNGRPRVGPAIPWKKSALTPNLGGPDETGDVRAGMGFEGVAALQRFVQRGGLLVTEGATSRLPVEMGFNATVSVTQPKSLRAIGAIFRAQPVDRTSPVLYGYDRTTFPVYFNQAPLLAVTARDTMNTREALMDPAVVSAGERQRARVLLKFHPKADSLLVSGLLVGGDELAGVPAVVDAPVGRGHVVLFAIRPMWRYESQGTFALVLNAMANWNSLTPRAGQGEAGGARVAVKGAR
jgi:hypothetical protein